VLYLLFYVAGAYYLLMDGTHLFDALVNESPSSEVRDELAESALNLDDEQ